MPKIRILHIGLTETLGGIGSYQKNLFDKIDKSRFELEFVTPYKNAALAPYFIENGATVYFLPPEKTIIPYCVKLYKIIKSGNYDIVHIHKNSCANPMAFFVAKLCKVPNIIAHSHNTSPSVGQKAIFLHKIFRKYVCQVSNIHLACSNAAAKWIFGDDENVIVAKNGIDVERFSYNESIRNDIREELGVKEDELFIGHVGNSIPQKNHSFMIEIMEELVKIRPSAKLFFIGEGEEMKSFAKIVKDKNLNNNIIFLGARTDTWKLYQGMDLFLFPSLHEGLPIALIEAQAAGIRCLISDKITSEVIITDNVTVLPLERNALEWASEITEILQKTVNKNTKLQIKESGYDFTESTKNIEKIYSSRM